MAATEEFLPDPPIRCRKYKIGAIGAGFIMADVQLASYQEAGFPVVAIASRTPSHAAEVAKRWGIATVHETPEKLLEDPAVEIADIAFPPDQQPALLRHAFRQKHIKGILAQKPLAVDFATARAVVAEAKASGKVLSVNQNMRFDQSMRVLKQVLDRGLIGQPVIATIDMRAIPHWQPFLAEYNRLGEWDYMAHKRSQALAFITRHPGAFFLTTLGRIMFTWTGYWSLDRHYLAAEPFDPPYIAFSVLVTGLMLAGLWRAFREAREVATLYAGILLFYPLVYYVTHANPVYRHVVDPEIVILSVYAAVFVFDKRRPSGRENLELFVKPIEEEP